MSVLRELLSLENPLNPDPGAPNPSSILKKIKELSHPDFPLELGQTIIQNKDFKDMYATCETVYKETGQLPKLAELSYDKLIPPTDQQIKDFEDNLYLIFNRWLGKESINLFPYVAPKLYDSHVRRKSYLIELDINDPYGITCCDNYDEIVAKIIAAQDKNFPLSECSDVKCTWYKNCKRIKWHWKASYPNSIVSSKERFEAYCRMHKSFMASYYLAVLNQRNQKEIIHA